MCDELYTIYCVFLVNKSVLKIDRKKLIRNEVKRFERIFMTKKLGILIQKLKYT